MSTIKSSADHIVINADGASKDIKFQANGVEKASISSAGAFTSTTIDATKLTGNLPAISGAALTGVGGGITEVDEWVLTADVSTNGDLTTNLSRNTEATFGKLGTGVSVSSGIFTFPSTGIWQVNAYGDFSIPSADYVDFYISGTVNNSTYTKIAVAEGGDYTGQITLTTSAILDVTSTTNVKVRFSLTSMTYATLRGLPVSTIKNTYFQFIKLAET